MPILFAADHAGFPLKEILIPFVRDELGYHVDDCGAYEEDPYDDYPHYVHKAATEVSRDPLHTRAIILGGSGQGEAIVANRHAAVRAAVFYGGDIEIVRLSREHNDANVLSLGARFLLEDEAREAVRVWLATSFSTDERHARRIRSIDAET